MEKQFFVYIMTNAKHSVLYAGVTSQLQERVYQHKSRLVPGFTSRYHVDLLMYYEELPDGPSAIKREKQIKGGSRQDKIKLVNAMNPGWLDLYDTL